MARPTKHPKTGIYRARKAVPADLRPILGKQELISSLRTKDPVEARRLHPERMAELERRIAVARAQASGGLVSLTRRQIAEIAGVEYRERVAHADWSRTPLPELELERDLLLDRVSHFDPEAEEAGRAVTLTKHELAAARDMLEERGVVTDPASLADLAEALWSARLHAVTTAIRHAAGDFSPDPILARYPEPEPPAVPAPPPAEHLAPAPVSIVPAPAQPAEPSAPPPPSKAPAVTTDALLARFNAETPDLPKTLAKRNAALRHLERAAGHNDATRIRKGDIAAMKQARLAKVSAATLTAEIAVLRPLWTWGIANGLLPDGPNPFAGMSPRKSKAGRTERLPFSDGDALALLTAARAERGWLRWVPWVLAFTGARLEEVCGAAAGDVREVEGAWCLTLHTEAEGRTLKTQQAQRMVPLADALIAEGFVRYARALPQGGPLFPDLAVGAYGKRSSTATKALGRRLRASGIKDARKVAGHSWRHRMKDLLRFARIPLEAADAILGHENAVNAGSGYGVGWRGRPAETKAEMEKAKLVPEGLVVPAG